MFFEWKMQYYALSVIEKKRLRCITSGNVHLWFTFTNCQQIQIINHILLIFKLYVYNYRVKHRLNKINLLNYIKEIKNIEWRLYFNREKKKDISKQIVQNWWEITNWVKLIISLLSKSFSLWMLEIEVLELLHFLVNVGNRK